MMGKMFSVFSCALSLTNANNTIKVTLMHHKFLRVTLKAAMNLNLDAEKVHKFRAPVV